MMNLARAGCMLLPQGSATRLAQPAPACIHLRALSKRHTQLSGLPTSMLRAQTAIVHSSLARASQTRCLPPKGGLTNTQKPHASEAGRFQPAGEAAERLGKGAIVQPHARTRGWATQARPTARASPARRRPPGAAPIVSMALPGGVSGNAARATASPSHMERRDPSGASTPDVHNGPKALHRGCGPPSGPTHEGRWDTRPSDVRIHRCRGPTSTGGKEPSGPSLLRHAPKKRRYTCTCAQNQRNHTHVTLRHNWKHVQGGGGEGKEKPRQGRRGCTGKAGRAGG